MSERIDFGIMTRGEVSILIGYQYGQKAREKLGIDRLDQHETPVTIIRPPELTTITPSFVQGFFGRSALQLGRDGFYNQYRFEGWPTELLQQVDAGIELALMDRPLTSTKE